MPISTGEALVSLIGGFLPGYARGRRYRAEQKIEAEERERKIATEEKVFDRQLQKENEKIAGRNEMFGLLETAGGISPQTPADEVLKIKAQYLDAAGRAGHDLKTAQTLFDDAVSFRRPEQPSPFDFAKLETEKARAQRYRSLAAKDIRKDENEGIKLILQDRLTGINDFLRQGALKTEKGKPVIPQSELEDAREEREAIEKLLLRADQGETITKSDLTKIETRRTKKLEEEREISRLLELLGLPDTPANRKIAEDVQRKQQRGGKLLQPEVKERIKVDY